MADLEKRKDEHVEDDSSTEGAARDPTGLGLDGDTMTLKAFLAVVAIATQLMAYLNTLLMPSTILAYIIADLDPNPNYAWITVSWNVCASVMVTVGGRLSDIFGRRYFFIFASVVALCGAVVGATGKSVNQMIASGVLFGIGGGLQEMAWPAVQEIVPIKHRVLAVGAIESSACVAFLSPMIAYAFIARTSMTWRAVYWYLFAFEAFSLIMVVLFYRPPNFNTKHQRDHKTRWQLTKEMDWVGFSLFTLGCVLFLIGVNWGGRGYAWSSAEVIATLVVGTAVLVALGFYEVYAPLKYPMLPAKLFRNIRGFTMLLVLCFVSGMLYYSMNVLWPRQSGLLFVPQDKPIIAGVYASMVSFGTIIAALTVAIFSSRIGHERWQLVWFITVQTALIGSLASIGLNDRAQAIATIIILSANITPVNLLSFPMITMGIEHQVDIGLANGLASTFRLMGGAVATAIYSAILANRFSTKLPSTMAPVIRENNIPAAVVPDLLQAAALNTADAYSDVPGITPNIIAAAGMAVKRAYVDAFSLVYLVAIAFGVLSLIAAFFTRSIPPERKTLERAIHMENESGGPRAAEVMEA